MRAAIYARVSTREQDNQNQLLQLRQFAATQGWTIIAEYCDEVSGSISDRPHFQAMFQAASRRQGDPAGGGVGAAARRRCARTRRRRRGR